MNSSKHVAINGVSFSCSRCATVPEDGSGIVESVGLWQ